MEMDPPENFHMDKLVNWFEMNLRAIRHIDDKKVIDKEWLSAKRKKTREIARKSVSPILELPNPRGFVRGGKGSGGHHINRILASREYMMRPGCFSDDKIEM